MTRNGFTLIELVIILVLIGILAVFVAPRMLDVTGTKAAAFADKLRAEIRYAQNTAMTANRRTRVYFNGIGTAPVPDGYAAVIDNSALTNCGSFTAVADPSLTGNLIVTLNTGDYAGIRVLPDFNCLEYDAIGRPYNCGLGPLACSTPAAALAAVMNIVVSANLNPAETVTIAAQTGAVN